ncbi:RNA-binding protein [Opitutaceae bacterium]|nr:RNA-binding protein [Opitutaceae bacterium]
MNSKLYIGNLSFDTTESTIRETFGAHGDITDIYVAMDRETGRPRGFAFVTFSKGEEAQAAIEALNGQDLDGRSLKVNEAKPRE